MHDKFEVCTVDVQVAILFYTTLEQTQCYVHTL